jgi:uncharacterized membrane protein YqgA involved in biofilm formation
VFPGFGTVVNVATVIIGSALGLLLGHRLPQRTRDTVTDALGLVTLLIGGLSAVEVTSSVLPAAVGGSAPVLIVLGSLSDGLGLGAQQLLLKATLDGFAAIAFAASLGVGVMASALAVAVIQGSLTLVGVLIGDFLPAAHLAAITATGGLLLVGVGLRLLQIKAVPVGNLLPALVIAPLLVQLVVVLR